MYTIKKVIKDKRILKAIIKKMCQENNVDIENIYVNDDYKYIETVDFNKKDIDFLKTQYKNNTYKCIYISGCFNPFICLI